MPVKNRFAELHEEITEWRHDLHANPEILFETHRTSQMVEQKLKSFGRMILVFAPPFETFYGFQIIFQD